MNNTQKSMFNAIVLASSLLTASSASAINTKTEALHKAPSNTACLQTSNTNLECPWELEYTKATTRFDQPAYAARGAYAVGYQQFTTQGVSADTSLSVAAWYPAANTTGAETISYPVTVSQYFLPTNGAPLVNYGLASQDAAIDASQGPYPLIVFSAGVGFSSALYSAMIEHFTSHGFIVLSPEHQDDWANLHITSIDRPKQVSLSIDLAESLNAAGGPMAGLIDLDNIAVVGHSYGGFTALAAGGARFNSDELQADCDALPQGDPKLNLCAVILTQLENLAERAGLSEVPSGLWPAIGDSRVTAIMPIAGDAYLFNKSGLASVTIPTLALGGTDDLGTPWTWGTGSTYENISSTYKVQVGLKGGNHSLVINPCVNMPWTTGMLQPFPIHDFLCFDTVWDKQRAHDHIFHYATAFLRHVLKGDSNAANALSPANGQVIGIDYQISVE